METRIFCCLIPLFTLASCQSLPLSTGEVGGKMAIVDSQGARVKMACVNWYGAHMEGHVVNGLDRQTVSSIANTIKEIGFNCVRLPFSLEQYYENPYVDVSLQYWIILTFICIYVKPKSQSQYSCPHKSIPVKASSPKNGTDNPMR